MDELLHSYRTRGLSTQTHFPAAPIATLIPLNLRAWVDRVKVRHPLHVRDRDFGGNHLEVILAVAEKHGVRAWDAAAFIAQQVFPESTVLDSPLSVAPPSWFPKGGMPNVVFG